jgi:hypothetical protein
MSMRCFRMVGCSAPIAWPAIPAPPKVEERFYDFLHSSLFVLDKATGQPVWPVEERPVPQGAAEGEQLSLFTQPIGA